LLSEVGSRISLPSFAIGGIDLSNVRDVVHAGCDRIAVTGAVRDADDPAAVIRQLREALRSG
jgi:thiamine-phosphate pyrophosphorylase